MTLKCIKNCVSLAEGENKMLPKGGVMLVPVILGITLISMNSSCIVIMILTFILLKKTTTTKHKQQGIEMVEGITIS